MVIALVIPHRTVSMFVCWQESLATTSLFAPAILFVVSAGS